MTKNIITVLVVVVLFVNEVVLVVFVAVFVEVNECLSLFGGCCWVSGGLFSTKKRKKNMGLKHWILPNNQFKTHLFLLSLA